MIRISREAVETDVGAITVEFNLAPLPLLHRSIVLRMHRTLRTDLKTIELFQSAEEQHRFQVAHQHISAWAQSAPQFNPDPKLPKILRGRAADNWRVLISIADSFGSRHWSKAARDAAVIFAEGYSDEGAVAALLNDIRTIFRALNVDRIKSSVLTTALHELEDGVDIWSAWRGENDDQSPHAISQGEIATLLKRFHHHELRPKPLFELGSRKERGKAGRGYYRHQFEKWWKIYCPDESEQRSTASGKIQMTQRAVFRCYG
jgi:hypothetical protein